MRKWIFIYLFTVLQFGCSTPPKEKIEDLPRAPSPNIPISTSSPLLREAAVQRSKQIGKISYTLWFHFDSEAKDFKGRVTIRFDLKPKAKETSKQTFLDFEEGSITSISVNGNKVDDLDQVQRFDQHRVYLSLNELIPTGNQIDISFSHSLSSTGNGLHRFKDPLDSRVYLYSNLEPYSAHRIFPCFDQPDIKATYEVVVEAPDDWTVISNTNEKNTTTSNHVKSWIFPPSAPFSTYVFALHAGPYSVWKNNANGIPLRLFSRRSLAQYVDFPEWFKVTQQGLDFFGVEFGFPYPFEKYDQLAVPEFNAGAMENVGAVTFGERYIFQTQVTDDVHRRRADTILHEMAHMWFGDLVTMRWWNGLWLNESFATFMASQAVEQATDFSGTWQAFFAGLKQWAYWEDQLVTTHPIELPMPDTNQAEVIFDGITYGKGASVLKQLNFYLGKENFKEGVQRYFQRFAFRNSNTADFIKMLSEASDQDLSRWQRLWLQTTGVNSIKPEWKCETDPETQKSYVSEFQLLQFAEPKEELRPHRTQVAFFYFTKGQPKRSSPLLPKYIFPVTYSAATTSVLEANQKPCPDFVFTNYQDFDYVKTLLGPEDVKFLKDHLFQVKDSLTRQMLWHSLWEMVTDGKLQSQEYAEMVLDHGSRERDTQILSKILQNLIQPTVHKNSIIKFLSGELRETYQKKIETWIRKHLLLAHPGSDLQLIWYQAFLDSATSAPSIDLAKKLLDGKRKLAGLKIDQEHRWELIELLSRNGHPASKEFIEKERIKDPSEHGLRKAISAEALLPDPEIKKLWLNRILSYSPTSELNLAKLREAMTHYHTLGGSEFTKATVVPFFEALPRLSLQTDSENQEYLKWLAKAFFPSLCDLDIVQRTGDLLSNHPELPASVVKSLRVGKQEEERCLRAREKSQR